MNIIFRNLLFTVLIFANTHTMITARPYQPHRQNQENILTRLTASTIPALLIGSILGVLCVKIEKKGIPIPLSWLLFSGLRTALITTISDEMKTHNISHHPQLMHIVGWISDWTLYTTVQ